MNDLRQISLETIDNAIISNRKGANEIIRLSLSNTSRRKKSRTRTKGEIEALNQISLSRWNKAVSSGKIKSLGERVLFYDYT